MILIAQVFTMKYMVFVWLTLFLSGRTNYLFQSLRFLFRSKWFLFDWLHFNLGEPTFDFNRSGFYNEVNDFRLTGFTFISFKYSFLKNNTCIIRIGTITYPNCCNVLSWYTKCKQRALWIAHLNPVDLIIQSSIIIHVSVLADNRPSTIPVKYHKRGSFWFCFVKLWFIGQGQSLTTHSCFSLFSTGP